MVGVRGIGGGWEVGGGGGQGWWGQGVGSGGVRG